MKTVDIGKDVVIIEEDVFKDCTALKTFTYRGKKGPTCPNTLLSSHTKISYVNVISTYSSDDNAFCGKTVFRY